MKPSSDLRPRVVNPANLTAEAMHGTGVGGNVFGDDRAGLNMWWMRVPAGQKLEPHAHPPDEIYLLVAGQGEIAIGDTVQAMGPGEAAWIPSGLDHAFHNTGETDCAIVAFSHLAVDAPKP